LIGWSGLRSRYVRTATVTKIERNHSMDEISTIDLDLAEDLLV
jgi:hypothetical protein